MPVILIIPTVKVTRTVAAVVMGMQALDRDVAFGGIILNRVATSRQESVIRAAVESATGLEVLGAIPRVSGELLSSRHLGLVTPEEHAHNLEAIAAAANVVGSSVDLERLVSVAQNTEKLQLRDSHPDPGLQSAEGVRIGYFRSPAFTFYYPENLEIIDRCGAVRVPIDPIEDEALPDLDALYIGGGFPETHAASLSANESFRASVAKAAQSGLPVWAECGGLIFLCRSLFWKDKSYPMAGVFPTDIRLEPKPAGHGYEEVVVDRPNPFLPSGALLRGHEFHYSRLVKSDLDDVDTIFQVKRGTGLGHQRDGLALRNVVASYLHLHALGSTDWFPGLLRAAKNYAKSRTRAASASVSDLTNLPQ
jgi:cobyrinic acid a,c-diamide synthase